MTKERPIIFDAESVRGILAGTKTQTRRVAKLDGYSVEERDDAGTLWPYYSGWAPGDEPGSEWMRCPYGAPGDILWCKETWAIDKSAPPDDYPEIHYRADMAHHHCDNGGMCSEPGYGKSRYSGPWKSPLYLRRVHSRITLRVTDVRVERAQDISEADARCEGLVRHACGWTDGMNGYDTLTARHAYLESWDAINA